MHLYLHTVLKTTRSPLFQTGVPLPPTCAPGHHPGAHSQAALPPGRGQLRAGHPQRQYQPGGESEWKTVRVSSLHRVNISK